MYCSTITACCINDEITPVDVNISIKCMNYSTIILFYIIVSKFTLVDTYCPHHHIKCSTIKVSIITIKHTCIDTYSTFPKNVAPPLT